MLKYTFSPYLVDFSKFGEPELRELMSLIGYRVSAKWRDIGSELGLTESDLDIIMANVAGSPNQVQAAMRGVFQRWHAAETSQFSWQTLANALSSAAISEQAAVRDLHSKLIERKASQ